MNPKLFISYSWTSKGYEERVLKLASDLRTDGVDVIIDKWDLKEGHDANAFMEQMVTDPDIQKVALLCDPDYAKKADQRLGGVGTEAQIVTSKIYKETKQDKFVAVIMDRNENGEICVPAYAANRIHVDLSRHESYGDQYDQLLRWIYDKPLHPKPEIGKRPAFLDADESGVNLETSTSYRRAIEAIRSGRENAPAYAVEFFGTMSRNFGQLRLEGNASKSVNFDMVRESVDSFRPYRSQVLTVFESIALHSPSEEMCRVIKRFLESLVEFMTAPNNLSSWRSGDFDNYRIIILDLFLHAVAINLKHERFLAAHALSGDYYDRRLERDGGRGFNGFRAFLKETPLLDAFNATQNPRKISPLGTFLKDNEHSELCTFYHLMQADFALYVKANLKGDWWYPVTNVYTYNQYGPFEIFGRSTSKAYFEGVKQFFPIENADEFRGLIQKIEQSGSVPRYNHDSLDLRRLSNFDLLATRD